MSQDFKFKNKCLVLALAVAFSSGAFAAEDKPQMSYGASAPAAPKTTSTPAVAQAPVVAAPVASPVASPAKGDTASASGTAAHASGSTSAQAAASAEKGSETATDTARPSKARSERTGSSRRHGVKKAAKLKTDDKAAAQGVTYSPQTENEITVSDRDLNDFIFSTPISNGPILPAGVPLVGKPIYMANNTQVLLQFQKGYDKPIQMVVETEDGKVHKLYLKPRAIAGVTYRVDGAKERLATARQASANAAADQGGQPGARAEDIELLKHIVRGDIPPDFEAVSLPKPTRFDKFTVVPLAGWSDNGSKKVMVFSLVAVPGQTAVVAPPEFYRQGITAVMITGDHVSDTSTPQLFVVEETSNE